jgi:hypothetical protein
MLAGATFRITGMPRANEKAEVAEAISAQRAQTTVDERRT